AITSVYPQTIVQTCIVHLIRTGLAFVSWKDRKAILPAVKAIYRAENADMALLPVLAKGWEGSRTPMAGLRVPTSTRDFDPAGADKRVDRFPAGDQHACGTQAALKRLVLSRDRDARIGAAAIDDRPAHDTSPAILTRSLLSMVPLYGYRGEWGKAPVG